MTVYLGTPVQLPIVSRFLKQLEEDKNATVYSAVQAPRFVVCPGGDRIYHGLGITNTDVPIPSEHYSTLNGQKNAETVTERGIWIGMGH